MTVLFKRNNLPISSITDYSNAFSNIILLIFIQSSLKLGKSNFFLSNLDIPNDGGVNVFI